MEGKKYDHFDKQGQAWEDALIKRESRLEQPAQQKELYAIGRRAKEATGRDARHGEEVGIQTRPAQQGYHTDPRGDRYYLAPIPEEVLAPPPESIHFSIQKQMELDAFPIIDADGNRPRSMAGRDLKVLISSHYFLLLNLD
jgi:hypothetical protein